MLNQIHPCIIHQGKLVIAIKMPLKLNRAGISISVSGFIFPYGNFEYNPSWDVQKSARKRVRTKGSPDKLKVEFSLIKVKDSNPACSGNSYLNATPALKTLTTKCTFLNGLLFSDKVIVALLQKFLAVFVLPTIRLYIC